MYCTLYVYTTISILRQKRKQAVFKEVLTAFQASIIRHSNK